MKLTRWTGPPKVRAPAQRLEEAEQRALMQWAACVQVGHKRLDEWLVHIPNGGARTAAEGGILKAMGVKAGMPDLLLPIRTTRYGSGYWELKADGSKARGRLSDAQTERLAMLRAGGQYVNVYWHWAEAAADILRYLEGGEMLVVCRGKL